MKTNLLAVADSHLKDDIIYIVGDMRFATVMAIDAKVKAFLKNLSALRLDFSQVTSSDSAGLALIIEWARYAKEQQKPISLQHLPNNLVAIAKVSGLDKVIEEYTQ